jgi:hypothetical protein
VPLAHMGSWELIDKRNFSETELSSVVPQLFIQKEKSIDQKRLKYIYILSNILWIEVMRKCKSVTKKFLHI